MGSRFSPESLQLREFLARNRIPHEWIDAERDAAVERLLRDSPYLGVTLESIPERCFDLVVIGGGPAPA